MFLLRPSFRKKSIKEEIHSFAMQKNYPCVAAIESTLQGAYSVGTYGKFGEGTHWRFFRADLLRYLEEQRMSSSPFYSFWAVFDEHSIVEDETDFEEKLWKELSMLTSVEDRNSDWIDESASTPENRSFCISLAGEKMFVVGMHPTSSRLARRFSRPALVFNAFSQFERLEKNGGYDRMVTTNRRRELDFQGSLNPMVTDHGDDWEAIQFSGRVNTNTWKCPFRFFMRKEKPA